MAQMANLQAALDWVGLADTATRDTKTSLWAVLGAPQLVRHLAALPLAAWNAAIAAWQVTNSADPQNVVVGPPSPVELGQVGTLRRVARLLMGLDPTEGGPIVAQQAVAVGAAAAVPAVGRAGGERKVKLNSVMDQADESEIKPMDPTELRRLVAEWRELENDGEDPLEEEEATGDQLAALDFRLKEGSTPFVDFGVWRPFGARFGRMVKFMAYMQLGTGAFVTKEINGPGSFEEWKKSWRVKNCWLVALQSFSAFFSSSGTC